jgi:Zn ribbon nucleic-acid-binding protein
MSAIPVFENLIKLISINADRLSSGKATLCKTIERKTIKEYLTCSNKNPDGTDIVECVDCPFNSVEASNETIALLTEIVKKEKVFDLLKGTPYQGDDNG